MTLYLIRHGHAEDRTVWHRPDIERPLIEKGIKRAYKAFSRFLIKYAPPAIIISSEAVRAYQTADILSEICGIGYSMRSELNPGAEPEDYQTVLDSLDVAQPVALVGHEPDMSEFLSEYLTGGELFAEFKKGSICHIQGRRLINLIQQKVLL